MELRVPDRALQRAAGGQCEGAREAQTGAGRLHWRCIAAQPALRVQRAALAALPLDPGRRCRGLLPAGGEAPPQAKAAP